MRFFMFFMSKSELQKKYNVNTTKTNLKIYFLSLTQAFFSDKSASLIVFYGKNIMVSAIF